MRVLAFLLVAAGGLVLGVVAFRRDRPEPPPAEVARAPGRERVDPIHRRMRNSSGRPTGSPPELVDWGADPLPLADTAAPFIPEGLEAYAQLLPSYAEEFPGTRDEARFNVTTQMLTMAIVVLLCRDGAGPEPEGFSPAGGPGEGGWWWFSASGRIFLFHEDDFPEWPGYVEWSLGNADATRGVGEFTTMDEELEEAILARVGDALAALE